MITLAIASAALLAWLYLLLARGGFWRAAERDDDAVPPDPAAWPDVVAVVPARDEADVIATSLGSLLAQDYPGKLHVVLVDDQSRDGTAAVAQEAARAAGAADRLTVLSGRTPPAGWAGKVWAMQQGVEHVEGLGHSGSPRSGEPGIQDMDSGLRPAAGPGMTAAPPRYILFTDADIGYQPGALRALVARAVAGDLALASLMVKLKCETWSERAFIPAFIFFFQMLYPFAWVNRPDHPMGGAAGGCMLVEREALHAAGGIAAVRGALIDDCALGQNLKRVGPIWLGLTERVDSLRDYPTIGDIRRMVARSAYTQLRYSPLLLIGTILGLALTYLAPPLTALLGTGVAQGLGVLTWGLMALAFQPTLRLYRLSPLWGLALPAIALAYMAFTIDSAYQHARGRGGLWKGRVHANASTR
jgi:glycosyltransferase involved in cell wall biosynthesis